MRNYTSVLRSFCSKTNHAANQRLTKDIDPNTLLCYDGMVKIKEVAGKGLGCFAEHRLVEPLALGIYQGEILSLGSLQRRYGKSVNKNDAAWQDAWRKDRHVRGITTTGSYILQLWSDPFRGRMHELFVDAEDCSISNWLRFINHSSKNANVIAEPLADGYPGACFKVMRDIEPGEELLLNYGPNYFGQGNEANSPID